MDQNEKNQAAMVEAIDTIKSKVDQFLETMLALARREDELLNLVVTGNVVLVQGSTSHSRPAVHNPLIYGLPLGYTPPYEVTLTQPQPVKSFVVTNGHIAQGPSTTSHIPPPRTDEELQNEYEMENYHKDFPVINPGVAKDSKVIQMCLTLEEKLRIT